MGGFLKMRLEAEEGDLGICSATNTLAILAHRTEEAFPFGDLPRDVHIRIAAFLGSAISAGPHR